MKLIINSAQLVKMNPGMGEWLAMEAVRQPSLNLWTMLTPERLAKRL
jgi:hypothetical protein